MNGIELIEQERKEQLLKHRRSIQKDVENNSNEQLRLGAIALLLQDQSQMPPEWDFELVSKMINKPYKERLIIAGTFVAAEIDRIQAIDNNPIKRNA